MSFWVSCLSGSQGRFNGTRVLWFFGPACQQEEGGRSFALGIDACSGKQGGSWQPPAKLWWSWKAEPAALRGKSKGETDCWLRAQKWQEGGQKDVSLENRDSPSIRSHSLLSFPRAAPAGPKRHWTASESRSCSELILFDTGNWWPEQSSPISAEGLWRGCVFHSFFLIMLFQIHFKGPAREILGHSGNWMCCFMLVFFVFFFFIWHFLESSPPTPPPLCRLPSSFVYL